MNKVDLRNAFLAERSDLSPSQIQSRNLLISQRLIDYIDWESHAVIHLYLPIVQNNEVDTFPLIQYLRKTRSNIRMVVPKVEPVNKLGHYFLSRSTKLVPNVWGIPEPVDGMAADIEDIDLVIVPMVIFDKQGHRIGYGKGYYDRFLAACSATTRKVGLCYFDPVEAIAIEPTDIPMDAVVTPDGVWEFGIC